MKVGCFLTLAGDRIQKSNSLTYRLSLNFWDITKIIRRRSLKTFRLSIEELVPS